VRKASVPPTTPPLASDLGKQRLQQTKSPSKSVLPGQLDRVGGSSGG